MVMKMLHYYYLLLFSLLFFHARSFNNSMSCSQTPYPDICFHFINQNDNVSMTADIDQTSHITRFRNSAIRATLNQAMFAHNHLLSIMNLDSFDDDDNDGRAKLALIDCLELYEDSIVELNRSAISSVSVKPIDHSTWLSASLANHQTCHDGFRDLGFSSDHLNSLFPFQILSNFSKLVSNSLAITKATAAVAVATTTGGRRLLAGSFPEWVSGDDRMLLWDTAGKAADMIVAQDGSGDFRTISEAVAAAAERKGSGRFVIYVKGGIYRENVVIKKTMKNVMIIGDGIDSTIVTAMKNVQDGSTTFRSATFAVAGEGFIAKDMTFENTAGPEKHQAVALRSNADHSVFYRCSFKGYQDTLYAHSNRQFYRECHIYGTIDFIFGDGAAIFQNCNIFVRKPIKNQKNTVTAQARSDPNENTGFVIHNSVVGAAPDLKPVEALFETYLGRPWKAYSRTVVMRSFLDGLIEPAGWLPWAGDFGLSTVFYSEFMNTGGGASTTGRVRWLGYHVMASAAEAGRFTVESFLEGGGWIPATGVPFANGL